MALLIILYVFQCDLICLVCVGVCESGGWGVLLLSFHWPSFCFIAAPFSGYNSNSFAILIEPDLCLSACSPPKPHQPLHQCKGALRPAKGKRHHRHAVLSRYWYCDKHNQSRAQPFIVSGACILQSSTTMVYQRAINYQYFWLQMGAVITVKP